MPINRDILKEFKQITGKDVESFLERCLAFFTGSYNAIVAYYSGNATVTKGAFDEFYQLQRECESIFATYEGIRNRLNNLKWWELLEQLETIDLRLKTLANQNKWSRSSYTKFGYDPSIQLDYILKPKQTLEDVAQDILGSNNPDDDWEDIALTNQLREEDYTTSGGVDVRLSFPRVNKGIAVAAIVDVIVGKSIYGKDIDRNFQFESDDLKVLNYDDTIQQSVEILVGLKKGDNPAYPNDGLQKEVTVGGNRAALNFPIITRQMAQTFATDDTLKNFKINTIQIVQDNLSIDFQVQTRLGEVQEGGVVV